MADTIDLLSLTEGKTAIKLTVSSTNHDTELAQFITGVSRRVSDLCGPVVVQTVTNESHDGGCTGIWLRETPVDSVSTVVEYRHTEENSLTAETVTNKPADAFLLDTRGHYARIIRRSGGADQLFPDGRLNVLVTYDAGRAADTASVDSKFKTAAGAILRRLWNREQGSWARGDDPFTEAGTPTPAFFKAVDPMVHELLGDEVRQRRAGGLMVR